MAIEPAVCCLAEPELTEACGPPHAIGWTCGSLACSVGHLDWLLLLAFHAGRLD